MPIKEIPTAFSRLTNKQLRDCNTSSCIHFPSQIGLGIRFMYSFCSRPSGWIKSRDEIHSSQTELLMRLTQEEMFAMFAFPSLGSGMSVVRPHSTCLSLSLSSSHIAQCF